MNVEQTLSRDALWRMAAHQPPVHSCRVPGTPRPHKTIEAFGESEGFSHTQKKVKWGKFPQQEVNLARLLCMGRVRTVKENNWVSLVAAHHFPLPKTSMLRPKKINDADISGALKKTLWRELCPTEERKQGASLWNDYLGDKRLFSVFSDCSCLDAVSIVLWRELVTKPWRCDLVVRPDCSRKMTRLVILVSPSLRLFSLSTLVAR